MVSLSKPDLVQVLGPDGHLDSLMEKAIAVLVATGLSDGQISKILDISEVRLGTLKKLPSISVAVLDIQVALSLSPEQRIANAVNTALDKKLSIMLTSKDEKLVDKVASDFLDRQYGKATQMIQSTSVSINANANQSDVDRKLNAVNERLLMLQSQRKKLTDTRPIIDVTPSAL